MKKFNLLSLLFLFSFGIEQSNAQWIEPAQYQQMLGSGMDVDWWTNESDYHDQDWYQTISDFNDAGIQHIRITLSKDYMSSEDFYLLDDQINQCINRGIIPIIAYKPSFARGRSSNFYHNHMVNWWRVMAEHYRNYPARLSFDILMEPNNSLFASYDALNNFYEDCVSNIRYSNPYRILFIAPTYNSDPLYLQHLRIPSRANGYLMAEWHFLSQANYNVAWNNWNRNRAYQESWVNRRINAAVAWQRQTGIYTWVGGWFPGSYYGSGYNSMQEAFTQFYCDALHRVNIPFAVRGVHHFYDYRNRTWSQAANRHLGTIFRGGNFAHSGISDRRQPSRNGFTIGGGRPSATRNQNGRIPNTSNNRNNRPQNGRIQNFGNGRTNTSGNRRETNSNTSPSSNSHQSFRYGNERNQNNTATQRPSNERVRQSQGTTNRRTSTSTTTSQTKRSTTSSTSSARPNKTTTSQTSTQKQSTTTQRSKTGGFARSGK